MTAPTQVPPPDFSYEAEPRKRVQWKWSLLIAAIGLVYLTWQCGSGLYSGSALANDEVHRFHAHLNSHEYDEICAEADSAFSEGERRDQLVWLLEATNRKLGEAGAARRVGLRVNVTMNGTFVTGEFLTQYATDQAHETFTWRKTGDGLKLYGYDVRSTAFLK
jgi:hypothetical protein